ncbi:arylsulfatase [Pedobacter heparinus]|uniref:arylsulfatase n=1 Tax=Pedobacter heparinus TaxID=984 RepID=UPI00292F827E|nr:arylsulfatase [Pedobacter heparinus]
MRIYLFTSLLILTTLHLSAQQKPNVIFILADDMGYGDLGCYGQQLIETPNIDKLAANGIRFTQFYAGTSVCAPSRASLMTGLHTGHTPIRGNYEIKPEGQLPLPDATYTMPELFKAAGYKTGAFGKWGMGFPGSEGDPVKQGVDQFYGYNCQRQSHNFFPDHLWDNEKRVELSNTLSRQTQYAPELIQKQAMAFMKANQSNPFFMYLAYTLPHAALQLPENDQAFEYYKKKFKEQPKVVKDTWDGIDYQPQPYPHSAYAAMVSKLDKYVGEVVKQLKALGLEKQTLIIFTSDNGPHTEGGNEPDFFNSNGGFKGTKRQLTEGGIREPMIACWPGKIKPAVSDHIGAFWDFMPSFAAAIGKPLPVKTDGISILPLLLNKGTQKQHDFLYWEFHEQGGRQAVRAGKWKAIREKVKQDANAPIFLYDLIADPKERNNLAAKHPDVVKKMAAIIQREHVENKDFPLISNKI